MSLSEICTDDNILSSAQRHTNRKLMGRASPKTAGAVLLELTEALRGLHLLMESYGPMWYTAKTAAQLRRTLAVADSALRTAVD